MYASEPGGPSTRPANARAANSAAPGPVISILAKDDSSNSATASRAARCSGSTHGDQPCPAQPRGRRSSEPRRAASPCGRSTRPAPSPPSRRTPRRAPRARGRRARSAAAARCGAGCPGAGCRSTTRSSRRPGRACSRASGTRGRSGARPCATGPARGRRRGSTRPSPARSRPRRRCRARRSRRRRRSRPPRSRRGRTRCPGVNASGPLTIVRTPVSASDGTRTWAFSTISSNRSQSAGAACR